MQYLIFCGLIFIYVELLNTRRDFDSLEEEMAELNEQIESLKEEAEKSNEKLELLTKETKEINNNIFRLMVTFNNGNI